MLGCSYSGFAFVLGLFHWVRLALIDGHGGFDCENVNFVGYIDCENVKFNSGFALVLGFGKNMKNKFLCFGFALVVNVG